MDTDIKTLEEKVDSLEKKVDKLQECVDKLVNLWVQAQGIVTFIKVVSAITGVVIGTWLFFKDHIRIG